MTTNVEFADSAKKPGGHECRCNYCVVLVYFELLSDAVVSGERAKASEIVSDIKERLDEIVEDADAYAAIKDAELAI